MRYIRRFLYSIGGIILTFNFLMLCFIPVEKMILPSTNPWLLKTMVLTPDKVKNVKSVILVHGFVGSPNDMKGLAERLSINGFRVIVPVMPAQTMATFPYNRGQFTCRDYVSWLSQIIDSEFNLTGRKPDLIGFSMGGTIAINAVQKNNIEKVILIAPFLGFQQTGDSIWTLTKYMKFIIPIVPKFSKGQIFQPQGYDKYFPGSYIISLSSLNRLGDLVSEARQKAPLIRQKTLLIVSINDHVASFEQSINIFKNNEFVTISRYNKSNHILLFDYDSEDIISEIFKFVRDGSN